MKKGIVMERHQKYMVVLTPDGSFEKAATIKGVDIGFEVIYEPIIEKTSTSVFQRNFFSIRTAALACIILIALLPLYFITNKNEAYAYVDIDINPSIELEISDNFKVADVKALNEDALRLLQKVKGLKGKKVEEAIDEIIHLSEENGYTNTAKNVLVGVHYVDKADAGNPLITKIHDHFSKKNTEWQVVTLEIPDEVRMKAEKAKQSMNEVLAKQVDTDKKDKQVLTEDEKEVLQSFYNRKNSLGTSKEKDTADEKPLNKGKKRTDKDLKEQLHPSELKDKNRDNHPKNNGKENQNKAKNQGKPHNIDINNSIHKGKGNNQEDHNKNRNHGKDGHKEQDKNKGKQHNKEHGKQKDNRNNGKNKGNNGKNGHHQHNNGNQKGKNKQDGFSYLHPYLY
ncbi:anti-sigma factor domain-containing protein [Ornithinibacillus bavariensis]|uniref:Anti-sigma-I factor RsgI n=1 Tax=Ornithinibacillus bavariensis TaxID=545502 RepID=A0A920C4F2_9BACI|nr:anti-sigma factor domain-containing protein [Ornithinibacillus bavariensis]GIO25646.1 anti-sigma-I factor RsgI [Ornithinibacillus bavariensis]